MLDGTLIAEVSRSSAESAEALVIALLEDLRPELAILTKEMGVRLAGVGSGVRGWRRGSGVGVRAGL